MRDEKSYIHQILIKSKILFLLIIIRFTFFVFLQINLL